MSTSSEDLIGVLSRWLAGHVGNARLAELVSVADRAELSAEQSEALDELLVELGKAGGPRRGELGRVVRETLEALARG
jgi:hypothetical protein